jgi:biotin synthase
MPEHCLLLQALCFMAGANSIFDGDKLLTTPNNDRNEDMQMFEELGLKSRPAFMPYGAGGATSDGTQAHAHA